MHKVKYYINNKDVYKVNYDLKKITCLASGEAMFPDFEENIEKISKFKTMNMADWKHHENQFFISRHFNWEHNGVKFSTIDSPIKWQNASTCGREAMVFHSGKIWKANDYYYPRIFLTRVESLDKPTLPIVDEETYKAWLDNHRKNTKWTDIKYCRNFSELKNGKKI